MFLKILWYFINQILLSDVQLANFVLVKRFVSSSSFNSVTVFPQIEAPGFYFFNAPLPPASIGDPASIISTIWRQKYDAEIHKF